MHEIRIAVALSGVVACAPALARAGAPVEATGRPERMLVACAPGYPGTTAQAQATMDRLASAMAAAAGWKPGSLGAVYHETFEGGVARLGAPDAVLALVTLPFYLQEKSRLGLKPLLQVVQESGATEIWSLVAKRGLVSDAGGLDGWEITGGAGFSADFVRGVILGTWGRVPATARITFTGAPLTALRRAASGEKTAVILDAAASAALPGLPFASDLEVVARSKQLPGSLLCSVGGKLRAPEADLMIRALLRMHKTADGAGVLKAIQVTRFEPPDRAAIGHVEEAFAGRSGAGPPDAGR
jgi:hypothetical protein